MRKLPKIVLLSTLAVAAFAGTAQAAVPGHEIIFKQSLNNSLNKTDNANCSPGKVPTGTGGRIIGGLGQATFNRLTPVDKIVPRVLVQGAEDADGFSGNWLMNTFAVCANPLPGYQVLQQDSPSNSSSKFVGLSCPTGKKVIGLGADLIGTAGRDSITQMLPTADLQRGTFAARETNPGFPTTWILRGYVICANPPAGLELVSALTPFDSFSAKSVGASCSPGKRLIGGGIGIGAGNDDVVAKELRPTATGFVTGAEEAQGGSPFDWNLRWDAICATA